MVYHSTQANDCLRYLILREKQEAKKNKTTENKTPPHFQCSEQKLKHTRTQNSSHFQWSE